MLHHTGALAFSLPAALAADARDLRRIAQAICRLRVDTSTTAADPESRAPSEEVAVVRPPEREVPPSESPVPEALATPPTWLSKREVAEHLRVSMSWIDRHMRLHDLPSRLVGGARRYRLDEVEAWVEARQHRWEANVSSTAAQPAPDRIAGAVWDGGQ